MESFFQTHKLLVKNVKSPIRRLLMDEIDWTHRLIGIKGTRGVGKTTFLLQFAKERFGVDNRTCLYVNFNNLYFTINSLVDFAGKFYKQGGRTLLLDQTFKYPEWSKELRICYEQYPKLQLIFSGSSVMRLKNKNADLDDIVTEYSLKGLSFREYLNLVTNNRFSHYSLEEILKKHREIAQEVTIKIDSTRYFDDYLRHGYYPFFSEQRNYSENLLKTINMMIEVDILLIQQIDLKYLVKIKKMFYLIMTYLPCNLNVSQLSEQIGVSRSTVLNYILYLKDARLLNLMYSKDDDFLKKPRCVYPHNTNLLHAMNIGVNREFEYNTFIFNALCTHHKVSLSKKAMTLVVDDTTEIAYLTTNKNAKKHKPDTHYIVDNLTVGETQHIPIWLLGFLY